MVRIKKSWRLIIVAGTLALSRTACAATSTLPLLTATPSGHGGETYTLSIQTLILMTMLVFLPAAVLMMSAFTRIIIVLALLRQALGTIQVPSNQVLIGLALFLTLFVMAPVIAKVNTVAVKPLLANKISATAALKHGAVPLRKFMLSQTRRPDLALFEKLSGHGPIDKPADTPMTILIPAFVTSELKTAFQIGFLLFIPFLIIDMIVAAVLMSLGMMMLSPITISLPFKLMLFVLVNGWTLTIGSLVGSFHH